MGLDTWNKWIDKHDSLDQEKRIKSAQKAECTPLEINADECNGKFQGSSGSYVTTLDCCECVDFSKRKLPCKHMYRLAIELGILSLSAKTDATKIKLDTKSSATLSEAIATLEMIPEESQVLLKSFLYEHLYHKQDNVGLENTDALEQLVCHGFLIVVEDQSAQLRALKRNEINKRLTDIGITDFKKNQKHEALITWCIDTFPEKITQICPNITVVTLSPVYRRSIRKVYSYLLRKFDLDVYYDDEMNERSTPRGAIDSFAITLNSNGEIGTTLATSFPDDEITDLLNKYNANRCLSGDKDNTY